MGPTANSSLQDDSTGIRGTFWEWKRSRVSCAECREVMVESFLRHHMESSHGIVLPHNRGVEICGGGSKTNRVSFTWVLKLVDFPVEILPSRSNNPGRLREHFMYRSWKSKVAILQEVPEPLQM